MTSRLISLGTKALAIGGAGVGATAWWHYQAVLREESNLPTNELWSFSHLQPSTADKKQCIIIGGGVVGITAAYKLAVKGHSVVLLEPNSAPGKEVSTLTRVDLFRGILLIVAHVRFLPHIPSVPHALLAECNDPIHQ